MVAAALVYFLSPWVESMLGPERTRTLQLFVFGVFAIYGIVYFFRFLGIIARKND